ncbi:MAG: hypothetical protein ACE5SW_12575 [Nitrososphaeraceae archaeon]
MSIVDQEKIIRVVQSSTKNILKSFQEKNIILKQYSKDIKSYIREGYDKEKAYDIALKLFGKNKTMFIAIDGIGSQEQHLDMLVFYAGAFGYTGELAFSREDGCQYKEIEELKGISNVSAAISIHEQNSSAIAGKMKEGGIETDPERIPSSLMQLAEYYFAVKSLITNPLIQVVILDRTMAGDVAHLVWSVEDLLESDSCILKGIDTEYGKVTSLDLELARIFHSNEQLEIPAPRSHLIKYAAINRLLKLKNEKTFNNRNITHENLVSMIGGSNKRIDKLRFDFSKLNKKYSIFKNYSNLSDNTLDTLYWNRILSASMKICNHIFNTPEGKHPLIIEDPVTFEKRQWITVSDIEYLILMMVYALLRLAWEKNVLVIGLVKDIGASEMTKTVIPLLKEARKIKENRLPQYGSDKTLLQTASVINYSEINAPWSTFEFDSCFRTIVPILNKKNEDSKLLSDLQVKGAFKNVISSERMFLKSYLQLWQSDNNPSVKSHVFSYDRPSYPEFDIAADDKLELHHEDGQVVEKIHPLLHFDNQSGISHLIMDILFSMSQEVIPECLGHNYPLFLADKKAKVLLQEGRQAYIAAVSLELVKSQLDQQVLFESSYREYRSQLEGARKRS